jgi:hypothetical protein
MSDDIKKLRDAYRSAQILLRKELTSISISAYKEMSAAKASAKIAAIVRSLNRAAARWSAQAMKAAYKQKEKELAISFSALGLKRKRLNRKQRSAQIASRASDIAERLFKANASIKRSADLFIYVSRKAGNDLLRIQEFDEEWAADSLEIFDAWFAEAIEAGWSRQRLSQMIKKFLSDSVDEEGMIRSISGNRHYSLSYYAEMFARTELRTAQSNATIDLCSEYECDLVEFSTHAKPCDECAGLEGQVFSISGKNPDYPQLSPDETPPIHPNCGHSIAPTTELALEFREKYS